MTQEEKQLLLKDLCGRLPYLVKGLYQWKGNVPFDRELDGQLYDELYLSLYATEDSSFKPYLRPLSSMTAEEKEELEKNYVLSSLNFVVYKIHQHKEWYGGDDVECTFSDYLWLIDWLNAHHFDYRGLIEKWLALEAPEGMYK